MPIKRWALIAMLPMTAVLAEDFPPVQLIGGFPDAAALLLLGGPALWPVFAVAVSGLVVTIERIVNLRRSRHAPRNFHKEVGKVVDMRGIDAALALCLEKSTSLTRVLYSALLRHGSARKEMEDAVVDEARRVLYDLRRNTRPLGVMSLLAFFLGLLGACVNFIAALNQAQTAAASADDRFERLAEGGLRALVPLAFGLATGIVLGILYFYLRGRAADLTRDVEEMGIDAVVTLDRKARQSIRLIEDLEEQIDTQDMPGIKPPDLEKEFEDSRDSSGLKTSITTHHGLGLAQGAATPAPPSPSAPTPPPPPQSAPKT